MKFKESLYQSTLGTSLFPPLLSRRWGQKVYMLLMSWAGEQARKDLMLAMGRDLTAETNGAVTKMLSCGVEHRDIRPPNVL
jgi:hypothetical protein